MKKIYALALGLLLAGVPQTGSAQFFKKLGEVLNEVDKALGEDTSKKENASETAAAGAKTSTNTASNGQIHQGNYHKNNLKSVSPRRTSATKLVSYDGDTPRVGAFSDGLAYVQTGGTKGGYFMDAQGNKVFDYHNGNLVGLPAFSSGRFIYCAKMNEITLVDTKGQVVKKIPRVLSYTQFVDGVATLKVDVPAKPFSKTYVMHINTNGDFIFKNLNCEAGLENLKPASPLRENRAAVYNYPAKRWAYRDANGKVVIAPKFTEAKDFSDGLALVAVKDDNGTQKWGYIDTTGVFVIAPKYTRLPGSFSDGLAPVVNKERKCFFIDKTGNIVSKAYDLVTEFHNGYAIVEEYGKPTQVINTKFETVAYIPYMRNFSYPFPCDGTEATSDFIWKGEDVYFGEALVTPLGDMVLYPVDVPFEEGYAPCNMRTFQSTDDKEHTGLINRQGEFVVEFVPNEF